MSVHVGRVTSEVTTTSATSAGTGEPEAGSEWDARARLAARLERLRRDRSRTATGVPDD
jgi:hypothetical protein